MNAEQTVALIVGLAWPVTVLVTLVIFRGPLKSFVGDLGQRVTKIDMKLVALDLRTEQRTNWRVDVAGTAVDIRALTTEQPFDSYIMDLLSQLERLEPTDVLVMDLGEADGWLSSRMYLFTSLLVESRGVRCIVFTRTLRGTRGSVLGCATPEDLRGAIAEDDPWLRAAFLTADAEVRGIQTPVGWPFMANAGTATLSPIERTPVGEMQVARLFIQLIQRSTAPLPGDSGWLPFATGGANGMPAGPTMWERGSWLDPNRLPGSMRAAIDRQSIVTTDGTEELSDLKRSILLQPGRFVILQKPDGTLKGVVERAMMLDQAVRSVLLHE